MEIKSKLKFTRSKSIFLHDLIMAAISVPLSLYIRLGDDFTSYFPQDYLIRITIGFVVLSAFIFRQQRMYWGIWRYASLNDLVTITRAVAIQMVAFVIALFFYNRMEFYPRSTIIINWFVLISLLGAPRFFYRVLKDRRYELKFDKDLSKLIPIILVGLGNGTDAFIRALKRDEEANYRIIGIIAEKDKRVGRRVQNIEVLGTIEQLPEVIKELADKGVAPQKMVLTRSSFSQERMQQLLDISTEFNIPLSRLPKADTFKSGLEDKIEIRPIAIEDLLRRPQRALDRESMKALINGRRVLVTGAGGSIGSELVRQIANFEPSRLVLFENSEFNLYSIDMEIGNKFSNVSRRPVVGDVRDKKRVHFIMEEERPELVFHAAALKHVPMTEKNILEGIMTNAIGTKIVADACQKYGVKAMVMISTDKAVNPSSVMGATKRLAESYCQAMDIFESKNKKPEEATRYVTVRFGNVLGSTGSVVPLFQKQLAEGGPLTVTHPEVKRYFMTIREAVELVLQASALGSRKRKADNKGEDLELHGKIFVLEMGEPVKIIDLAKQVIRLAGLKPDEDVKIEITGLREGEKLFEEIFHGSENLVKTGSHGILLAEPRLVDKEELSKKMEELLDLCNTNKSKDAKDKLHVLVPEFVTPEI